MRVAGALIHEGHQLGRQKGLLEAAHKMLAAGVDVGIASRAMGLPRNQLTALRAKD